MDDLDVTQSLNNNNMLPNAPLFTCCLTPAEVLVRTQKERLPASAASTLASCTKLPTHAPPAALPETHIPCPFPTRCAPPRRTHKKPAPVLRSMFSANYITTATVYHQHQDCVYSNQRARTKTNMQKHKQRAFIYGRKASGVKHSITLIAELFMGHSHMPHAGCKRARCNRPCLDSGGLAH